MNKPQSRGAESSMQVEYAEHLPPSCPCSDAEEKDRDGFWRFIMNPAWVSNGKVSEEALSSQYGRNVPVPNGKDPCDWASCSLFTTKSIEAKAKLPAFRKKKRAKFNIPASAGVSRLDPDGHLHLWRYANVDLSNALIEVTQP